VYATSPWRAARAGAVPGQLKTLASTVGPRVSRCPLRLLGHTTTGVAQGGVRAKSCAPARAGSGSCAAAQAGGRGPATTIVVSRGAVLARSRHQRTPDRVSRGIVDTHIDDLETGGKEGAADPGGLPAPPWYVGGWRSACRWLRAPIGWAVRTQADMVSVMSRLEQVTGRLESLEVRSRPHPARRIPSPHRCPCTPPLRPNPSRCGPTVPCPPPQASLRGATPAPSAAPGPARAGPAATPSGSAAPTGSSASPGLLASYDAAVSTAALEAAGSALGGEVQTVTQHLAAAFKVGQLTQLRAGTAALLGVACTAHPWAATALLSGRCAPLTSTSPRTAGAAARDSRVPARQAASGRGHAAAAAARGSRDRGGGRDGGAAPVALLPGAASAAAPATAAGLPDHQTSRVVLTATGPPLPPRSITRL